MELILNYDLLKKYGCQLLISIIIIIVVHFINKLLHKTLNKNKNRLGTNYHVTVNIFRFLTYATAFVWILQIFGFNVSSIIAGLGIASVTVGLAFQDFLKDILAGFGILYEHFFEIGDVIIVNGMEGEVIGFTVKTTKLKRLATGSTITVSNREISTAEVMANFFDLDLSLSYEEDLNKVNSVLTTVTELIKQLPNIQNAEYLGTNEFKDSSIIYKIRYYCEPKLKYNMQRSVIQLVQKELSQNNISIAYNQIEVNSRIVQKT